MTDNRRWLLVQMFEQSCQIGEKILMLIAAARTRPFAIAMSAQVEGHGMLYRHAAPEQRLEKMIPAPALIAHAMHENICLFTSIAPFPVTQPQSIMFKKSLPRL